MISPPTNSHLIAFLGLFPCDMKCPDPSSYADPHVWQTCENYLTLDTEKATSVAMHFKLVWNSYQGNAQTEDADYDDLSWVCVDCE